MLQHTPFCDGWKSWTFLNRAAPGAGFMLASTANGRPAGKVTAPSLRTNLVRERTGLLPECRSADTRKPH